MGLLFWFEIRPTQIESVEVFFEEMRKSVTDSPPFLLCFQENLELEQLGITPCAHYFCLPCLTQQVERNQRCGVCRHPLKSLGLSSRSMGCAAWVPDEMVWIMDDHVDERCTPPVHTHTARRTHHNISHREILKHVFIYTYWHVHMICINYICCILQYTWICVLLI